MTRTQFTDWKQGQDYNHLDRFDKYIHASGVIPTGTTVQFKADKTTGTVIHSNQQRSLIEYAAPPRSGMSGQRDWFNNDELRVPT